MEHFYNTISTANVNVLFTHTIKTCQWTGLWSFISIQLIKSLFWSCVDNLTAKTKSDFSAQIEINKKYHTVFSTCWQKPFSHTSMREWACMKNNTSNSIQHTTGKMKVRSSKQSYPSTLVPLNSYIFCFHPFCFC